MTPSQPDPIPVSKPLWMIAHRSLSGGQRHWQYQYQRDAQWFTSEEYKRMKNIQPDLLPDDSGPVETFVRFDELDAFYARCRAEHTRCIIQSLDRKRHGYVCVVVTVDRPRVASPESVQKFLKM